MPRKKTNQSAPNQEYTDFPIKPIKEATTPTLSGSSKITYQIGVDDQGRLAGRKADLSGDMQEAVLRWHREHPWILG